MKPEEINTIPEQVELSLDELDQVAGGEDLEHGYTIFACYNCGEQIKWPGTNYNCWSVYNVDCAKCDSTDYHWVKTVY
ncbi:MAG: hypothetical protein Q4G19_09345 [Clostridia bacterium]|nr:hypothetical protein [Clostridia bacterium]